MSPAVRLLVSRRMTSTVTGRMTFKVLDACRRHLGTHVPATPRCEVWNLLLLNLCSSTGRYLHQRRRMTRVAGTFPEGMVSLQVAPRCWWGGVTACLLVAFPGEGLLALRRHRDGTDLDEKELVHLLLQRCRLRRHRTRAACIRSGARGA